MASPPTPGPSARPGPAEAVTRIALQVGATSMAHVDVAAMLSAVCAALPGAVGVAGVALVLTEPADPRDPVRYIFASDEVSARLGLIQHRAARGPVPAAVRGDRPLVVPDLTASGPPELAAAAADCGLVRSLVVPVPVAGRPAGGLQLLAAADTALEESDAVPLRPLVEALSARLADVREIARLQRAAAPTPDAEPPDTDVPGADAPAPDPAPADDETVRLNAVPSGSDDPPSPPEGDAVGDLFATGEPPPETPPIGQARLGWEGPDHTPPPTQLPVRALPARVRVVGRAPRPTPAAVPEQRSGPLPEHATVPAVTAASPARATAANATGLRTTAIPVIAAAEDPAEDVDGPTARVARHRLRDDA